MCLTLKGVVLIGARLCWKERAQFSLEGGSTGNVDIKVLFGSDMLIHEFRKNDVDSCIVMWVCHS